jgi:enamine deaminase RidA (YjgF/YER057c/UK114 family)
MTVLQPADWPRPSGYANGVSAEGVMVFVAGQIGWNQRREIESDDLVIRCVRRC